MSNSPANVFAAVGDAMADLDALDEYATDEERVIVAAAYRVATDAMFDLL